MSSIGRRAFARILLLAAGLVSAAACGNDLTTANTPRAPRFGIDPNAWYVIRNIASNKVMDVESAGCCNGYIIHQWTYQGLTNQQWQIQEVGGGYYKVVARHSGRVMDVKSASLSEGATIHQWGYDGSLNQQWSVYSSEAGGVYFIARHSGKAAGVVGYSNGDDVRQYTYTGAANQRWLLEFVL
ncbi:MAG TPA: RICIN domain-containing protein [Longimicrobium sp.]|nr:RICIN domain-containing protein [Longimicrobium sp.]